MKKIIENIKGLSFYETLKHGSVYTISFAFIQLISVISLPIFTKLLKPADFGVYEVFNNTVRLLAIVLSLNLFNGFYRYSFEKGIDKKYLIQFLLRTSFISFLVGSVLLLVLKKWVLSFLNIPEKLFVWLFIAIFSNIIFNFFNVYNNTQQKSVRLGIWQFVIQFLKVSFAVILVYYFSRDYYGRILGENILLFFASFLIIVIYFRNYIGINEVLPDKKEIVRYAVSFIPISLSGFILGYLDTIMINKYKGNSDAGLYSYVYKIAIIYTGITTSFITANRPKLFELLNENNQEEVIKQLRSMFKVIVALSCLFILFASTGGKILALNKAFYAGLYLTPFLILSYVFSDINEILSFYFYFKKKVKYFYYTFAISALINLILNIILIPKYGYQMAAYTTLISYFFMASCTYLICKKLIDIKIPAVIHFIDFVVILVLTFVVNFFIDKYLSVNDIFSIGVKFIYYLVIVIYLWRNIISKIINK